MNEFSDTKRQFKSDLDQKSGDLQSNITNLDKTTKEQFKDTKNDLNKTIQMESEKTTENFQALRKDLRQIDQNLRENDDYLEKKLEGLKTIGKKARPVYWKVLDSKSNFAFCTLY